MCFAGVDACFLPHPVRGQDADADMASKFGELAAALRANEDAIVGELAAVQGSPADIGGYYVTDKTVGA